MYQQDKIQKSSLPVAQWATKKEAKGGVNAVQSRPEEVASPAKENRNVMAKSRDGMLNNVLQTLRQGADSDSGESSLQATPVEEQKLAAEQGKGDWQQQANLSTIFGGSGSALPQGLMAKYQQLMPGVSLSHVRLHQGSQVDASLAKAGLQGLTDGTRVAVSGKAESGTLEHELGHVAQRQVQGFNLTEGNRQAYEQDADRISARLVADQPVEGFYKGYPDQTIAFPVHKGLKNTIQTKCAECEQKDKQLQPMGKVAIGQGQLQAQGNQTITIGEAFKECASAANLGTLLGSAVSAVGSCGAVLASVLSTLIALGQLVLGAIKVPATFGASLLLIVDAIADIIAAVKAAGWAAVACAGSLIVMIGALLILLECMDNAIEQAVIEAANEQERQLQEAQRARDRRRIQQLKDELQSTQEQLERMQQQ